MQGPGYYYKEFFHRMFANVFTIKKRKGKRVKGQPGKIRDRERFEETILSHAR